MNQLNNLIIEGNFVDGKREENVFNFSVAYNRFYKDENGDGQNETSFFDVECYGNNADLCEKHFQKGRGIRIVGRLKQVEKRVVIVAEHVELKPRIK